jgi:hypothetical protein
MSSPKPVKVGDATHYDEACNILQDCKVKVNRDTTLLPMIQAHASMILFHAQCYVMLIKIKIGDYNGY